MNHATIISCLLVFSFFFFSFLRFLLSTPITGSALKIISDPADKKNKKKSTFSRSEKIYSESAFTVLRQSFTAIRPPPSVPPNYLQPVVEPGQRYDDAASTFSQREQILSVFVSQVCVYVYAKRQIYRNAWSLNKLNYIFASNNVTTMTGDLYQRRSIFHYVNRQFVYSFFISILFFQFSYFHSPVKYFAILSSAFVRIAVKTRENRKSIDLSIFVSDRKSNKKFFEILKARGLDSKKRKKKLFFFPGVYYAAKLEKFYGGASTSKVSF